MNRKKILFVCFSNVYNSPAAEAIFRKLSWNKGIGDYFEIDSAGLSAANEGQFPDLKMMRLAHRRGYNLTHRVRKIRQLDIERFDYFFVMDQGNLKALLSMAQSDLKRSRIFPITDFCMRHAIDSLPDPLEGEELALDRILDALEDACSGLLEHFITEESYS